MLVFNTFAGDLLEPREADRLYRALAIIPENMSSARAERLFVEGGLRVLQRQLISSEWREHDIENGNHQPLRDLLTIARVLRAEAELVAGYGRMRYEMALANAMWWPFQLCGKLTPEAFSARSTEAAPTLRKASRRYGALSEFCFCASTEAALETSLSRRSSTFQNRSCRPGRVVRQPSS